jgi:hypothetical protein
MLERSKQARVTDVEMRPTISFIVPVRNDAARLGRCLETMRAPLPFEIIVVDNGSTDGSADVARAAGALVLELPEQRVAALRNAAAAIAAGELLAFVDADHELGRGWSDAAVAVFRQEPDAVAVGSPYQAPPDGTWVQRMYDRLRRRPSGLRLAEWLPSGNLVVKRSTFEAVGGFDTSLETCEDVDLCHRLRSHGEVFESEGLVSVHRGDPPTLRALFLGELWRGRDNFRVTLRGPLSLRSLPSLLLPVAILVACSMFLLGAVTWSIGGWWLVVAGAGVVAAVVLTRTASLFGRVARPERNGRAALEALLVSGVYDAARALALVARPSHDLRRRG